MRTLQEKYNGIQEGKFSKEHFLAEARMQQPQLITRFNGYDDAVQILKNRGMIAEAYSAEESFKDYSNDALTDMIINLSRYENNEREIQGVRDELARRKETVKEAFSKVWDKSKLTKTTYDDGKYHSSEKFKTVEDLLADKEKTDAIQKKREEKGKPKTDHILKEASYKVSKNSKQAQHLKKGDIITSGDEIISVSAGAKTPAGKVEVTMKTKNGSTKTSTWGKTTMIGVKPVTEANLTENTNTDALEAGDVFRVTNRRGHGIEEKKNYKITAASEYVIKFHPADNPKQTGQIDTDKFKGWVERGDIIIFPKQDTSFSRELKEAKLTKKSLTDYRYKPTNDMDKYPYEQILRGIRVELEALEVHGTPTAEEYSKALAKVSKNLAKDSIFYTNQLAGVNPKVDLHDKMIPVTAKNTVDTFNGMKKAALKEGFKKLIKKVLSSNLQEGYQAGDRVTFVDSNGGKSTSGVVVQDLGQDNFTFKASQDGKTYSTKGLDRGRWKIEKEVAEAMGDMFGDEERAERSANYGQPGENEYEFYSDPENYNEAEEEFELQGEDGIDYDDENFSDPFIDGDLDESRMGDIHLLAQESDTLKDFLIAVKQQYPKVDIRRDIKELQDIWKSREGLEENYFSNYGMDDDGEEEEDDSREGLMIIGRTREDNNAIGDLLDELELYGEWEAREGYWFLPEEEENYDNLEEMLEQEFTNKGINARFEGVFRDQNQIQYRDQEEDLYEGKQSLSELLK